MAKIQMKGLNEYAKKLSDLERRQDEVAAKAVYAGAGIVADEIKKRLQENLDDPAYAGLQEGQIFKGMNYEQTGELLDSFGVAPIKVFADMNTSTKLGFDGYDEKGVPNQLKARAMESGTSKLKKRPFVRPAVNATKKQAISEMGNVIDEEYKKITGG